MERITQVLAMRQQKEFLSNLLAFVYPVNLVKAIRTVANLAGFATKLLVGQELVPKRLTFAFIWTSLFVAAIISRIRTNVWRPLNWRQLNIMESAKIIIFNFFWRFLVCFNRQLLGCPIFSVSKRRHLSD